MTDQDLKQTIKRIAVEHFNRSGYHGTTIRTIASEAGCSLPMVYYYFKSKKELFHEIIKEDYFGILKRESERLDSSSMLDFYTNFILNVMHLNSYEKKIYRLGIKVYLSFDGDDELLSLMEAWEASIIPRHSAILLPHFKGRADAQVRIRTLMHLMENLIEGIVVKSKVMSEEEIRQEISIVLGGE